jgi:uncharacterized protein YjiS (DUF1127 family)
MRHAAPPLSEAPAGFRPGLARSDSEIGPLHRLLSLAAALRNRRRLAELPGHLLEDLGLTQEEAAAEARRPLWDVPPQWRAPGPLVGRTGS